MSKKEMIYLDNAATTRCLDSSLERFVSLSKETFGNPSSIHHFGVMAEDELEEARAKVASCLNVDKKTIFFTSGGTESNNMAIIGAAKAKARQGMHVITSSIEHSSVKNTIERLEGREYDITFLPVDENGMVRMDALVNAIDKYTVLVSVMLVNNETGVIQPVEEICNIIKQKNDNIIFHVDAVQAVGKLPINLKRSRIDLLSASGHKFHGPKGVGFLYKKERVRLPEIVFGGGQEGGLRSGTVNVPGICAMADSLQYMCENMEEHSKRLLALKGKFIRGIEKIEGAQINGYCDDHAIPNILNVSFKDIRSEVMVHALEEDGIYVSSGSACSSHSKKVSGTLNAMGLTDARADSAVRFSFSIFTTEEDIDKVLLALNEKVDKLSGFTRK